MIVSSERDARSGQPAPAGWMVRLLGSVDVLDRGRVLEVGPPQRQAVLAALAVDVDHPVQVEVLVDRVWGGNPPDGARAALHAHIARLRRALAAGDGTPAQLTRRSQGYVLQLDPHLVDLHQVRWLLDQAREPDCDDNRRMRLLCQVLHAWRGTPLAGVPGDWAERVRAAIETQLITAAVEWARAAIRLGRAESTIDRLSQLTSRHPFSEPLVAELMRALCAVGRGSEAVQHYAAIRSHLRAELGVEPGPDLGRLHTAILRGELGPDRPRLEPLPGPFRQAPPRPRPRELPTATRLAGREGEAAEIERAFATAAKEGSMAVVAINGYAGVGKSALATHVAHRLVDRFPDGQLYANLEGRTAPQAPAEVLDRFLRTLGVPESDLPGDVEAAAARFRTLTADLRLLVVLDNASSAAQVKQLWPGAPGCGVLVTSRRILVGLEGAAHVQLDVLDEPAAVEMLRHLIGAARVDAEPRAAAEVARRCGYLPLALRIAGARLAARPGWAISAFVRRLADDAGRLAELEFGGFSVRDSFAASYQELIASSDPLDRLAGAAFARLGGSSGKWLSGAEAARLLDCPVRVAELLLERLVDARLLDSRLWGWYRFPPLLQLYARQLPEDAAVASPGGHG